MTPNQQVNIDIFDVATPDMVNPARPSEDSFLANVSLYPEMVDLSDEEIKANIKEQIGDCLYVTMSEISLEVPKDALNSEIDRELEGFKPQILRNIIDQAVSDNGEDWEHWELYLWVWITKETKETEE